MCHVILQRTIHCLSTLRKTGPVWNTSRSPFINMWLYEKIVSQRSEPEGGSWTESSTSCHVRCCWGFLAVRTETDTQCRHTRTCKRSMACTAHKRFPTSIPMHMHTDTHRKGFCLCSAVQGVWVIGQAWHPCSVKPSPLSLCESTWMEPLHQQHTQA